MFRSFHHSESVLRRNAGTAETPSVEETLVQVPTITAHIEQCFLTGIGQAFRPVGRGIARQNEPSEGFLFTNRAALMLHSQVSYLLGGFEIRQAFSHLHIDRINIML